jgi:hypothetical protein
MKRRAKKTRKTDKPERLVRRPLTRREAIKTLAAGTGGLMLANSVLGGEVPPDPEDELGHWVYYKGYAYRITGLTDDGWWVVDFFDGQGPVAVFPGSNAYDEKVYYPIGETTEEGVFYIADGYFWLLDPEQGLEYLLDVQQTT